MDLIQVHNHVSHMIKQQLELLSNMSELQEQIVRAIGRAGVGIVGNTKKQEPIPPGVYSCKVGDVKIDEQSGMVHMSFDDVRNNAGLPVTKEPITQVIKSCDLVDCDKTPRGHNKKMREDVETCHNKSSHLHDYINTIYFHHNSDETITSEVACRTAFGDVWSSVREDDRKRWRHVIMNAMGRNTHLFDRVCRGKYRVIKW